MRTSRVWLATSAIGAARRSTTNVASRIAIRRRFMASAVLRPMIALKTAETLVTSNFRKSSQRDIIDRQLVDRHRDERKVAGRNPRGEVRSGAPARPRAGSAGFSRPPTADRAIQCHGENAWLGRASSALRKIIAASLACQDLDGF